MTAASTPLGERSMTLLALPSPRLSKAHIAKSAALIVPALALMLVAGTAYGRVRAMTDENGEKVEEAANQTTIQPAKPSGSAIRR